MRFGSREFWGMCVLLAGTAAGSSSHTPASSAERSEYGGAGAEETLADQAVKTGASRPGSDPYYAALRQMTLGKTRVAAVSDWQWKRDVGSFRFRKGYLYLFPPVLERVTGAVFVGEGEFQLDPFVEVERNYLKLAYGKESVQEPVSAIVFRFTDTTLSEWEQGLKFEEGQASPEAIEAFRDHQKNTRTKLQNNAEAAILADLLDKGSWGTFAAFIKAKKSERLLFAYDLRGVDPELGPEEVMLMNYEPHNLGIWYLFHTQKEWADKTASYSESRFPVDLTHVAVDAQISGREKLSATATLSYTALRSGPRVLRLGLAPQLRVTRVLNESKQEAGFIQEDKDEDAGLFVILPAPLVQGEQRILEIEYSGKEVVQDAGGGNFYVSNRTSWFPSFNSFKDYATYDLTFRVPKGQTLVGTGAEVKNAVEGGWAVTQWRSETPIAVAGFNFARYKKKAVKDSETRYELEGYSTTDSPDWLRGLAQEPERAGGFPTGARDATSTMAQLSPSRLADQALAESQAAVRLYSRYFGALPYGRIAITQQPDPSFGQSWPMLVYLPLTAFMDKTQLHFIFGSDSLRKFVDEVGSHEVAHQWWGHWVGWASYRDQWLSEGFATFSAGLYLEASKGRKRAAEYWADQRKNALETNRFGYSPNQAGPIWMGLRLGLPEKASGSYQLVYSKGGFILHMLRSLMWDREKGDQAFINMMKDFVAKNAFKFATTEDFQAVAEKHMTPQMDVNKTGRLDWFFSQWVFGTQVPTYKFTHSIKDAGNGQYTLSGELTQSGVSPNFVMPVPVYVEFDKDNLFRLGTFKVQGGTTVPFNATVKMDARPKRLLINAREDVFCGLDSKN